jgi:hypothetical protein
MENPETGPTPPEKEVSVPEGEAALPESEPSSPEGGPAPTMAVKYYGQVKDRLRWTGLYLWVGSVFGGVAAVAIGQFGSEEWATAGQYALISFVVLFIAGVLLFILRKNTRVFCGHCQTEVARDTVQCPGCGVVLYDFLNKSE